MLLHPNAVRCRQRAVDEAAVVSGTGKLIINEQTQYTLGSEFTIIYHTLIVKHFILSFHASPGYNSEAVHLARRENRHLGQPTSQCFKLILGTPRI